MTQHDVPAESGRIDDVYIAENTIGAIAFYLNSRADAQMCYAYQQVPPCLDIDYDPGGNLSWTDIVQRPGPSLSMNTFNYTHPGTDKFKMSFRFTSDVALNDSGEIVCGPDWSEEYIQENF